MNESLIKRLIASIKCASCGQNYEEDHIHIIEHRDELWFLRVSCASCRTSCLVAAIIRQDATPEIVTDLTPEELKKFQDLKEIGEEDLLEMHRFLKDFNGDFPGLFRLE
jgi:hypothetical protein